MEPLITERVASFDLLMALVAAATGVEVRLVSIFHRDSQTSCDGKCPVSLIARTATDFCSIFLS